MPLLAASAADVAYYALAVFLVAVGLGLGYAFVRLGGTFARLSSFIRGTEREVLPVIQRLEDRQYQSVSEVAEAARLVQS